MCEFKTQPLQQLMRMVHPDLYRLDNLSDKVWGAGHYLVFGAQSVLRKTELNCVTPAGGAPSERHRGSPASSAPPVC